MVELSHVLWMFLGAHFTDEFHPRREALAGGQEGNGLELWRQLYWTYEGGAMACRVQGVRHFHTFPQCKKIEDLGVHLGEWQRARAMYAHSMPEDHAK